MHGPVPLPVKPVGQGPHTRPPVERGVQETRGLVEHPPLLVRHWFTAAHPEVPFPVNPAGHAPHTAPEVVLVHVVSGSQPPLLVEQKLIGVHPPGMLLFPVKPAGQGPQVRPGSVKVQETLESQPPLLVRHTLTAVHPPDVLPFPVKYGAGHWPQMAAPVVELMEHVTWMSQVRVLPEHEPTVWADARKLGEIDIIRTSEKAITDRVLTPANRFVKWPMVFNNDPRIGKWDK